MSSTLRNTISDLAATFAASVLDALRGASLEEILAESRGGAAGAAPVRRGPGRPRANAVAEVAERKAVAAPASTRRKGGRLSRRSQDDIGMLVDKIVDLLANSPEGLRAEQIRESLGLEAKELPRPLNDALRAKRIAKQGQKRATTYFARGAGGAKAAGGRGAKSNGASKASPRKAKPGPKPGKRGGKGRRGAKAESDGGNANQDAG